MQIVTYQRHTHQVHVMMGGKAYPIGHEKQLTLYLLNNILGGGALNSRLNLSMREKRGLVYTVESTYTPLSDTGYWSVYFACDKEDKDTCIQLVMNELKQLREIPLTESQLNRAKHQLHGQMAIAAQNEENNALSMAKQMLYQDEYRSWEETFQEIERVTPDDIQEVAKELFDEQKISILSYQ